MQIDQVVLEQATGLRHPGTFACDQFALATQSASSRALGFLDDTRFIAPLAENVAIVAVITTGALAARVTELGRIAIVSEDPRDDFYRLHNYMGKAAYVRRPSVVHSSAQVHPRASIGEFNVVIGAGCVIEAGAVILPDVTMGEQCIVGACAVVGSEGFEHKRTSRGIRPVFHDGVVILGARVEIGSNSCIDKGFSFRSTIIGDDTKIDNLVHIAHGVHTGRRCLIVAHAMVAGSVTLGDDAWVGPGVMISNGLVIGDGAHVTIGAVVTRDVAAGTRVSGNFAVPHDKLLRHIKAISAD